MRRAGIGEDTNDRGRQVRVLITFPQERTPRSALMLYSALEKLGAGVRLMSLMDVSCDDFAKYDVVLMRGLPYHIDIVSFNSLVTCTKGSLVINDPMSSLLARDKFSSMKVLEEYGVPVPKTFLVKSRKELVEVVSELGEAIIKPLSSSLGIGVELVTEDSVNYFVNKFPFRFEAVVQEHLEKVRDVRVLVIGNKAIGAMYRISPFSIATNYSKGAEVEPAPLEPYAELAIEAVRALGLEYGGVDLIETPEGPKVIEVNPSPLWLGLSKVTKRDITSIIAEYVISRAYEVKSGSEV